MSDPDVAVPLRPRERELLDELATAIGLMEAALARPDRAAFLDAVLSVQVDAQQLIFALRCGTKT